MIEAHLARQGFPQAVTRLGGGFDVQNALRFAVKLRRWRNEARFAREARLRRMKCLPIGKR